MAQIRRIANGLVGDFNTFAKYTSEDLGFVIVALPKELLTRVEDDLQRMVDNESFNFDDEDGSLTSDNFEGDSIKELIETFFDISEEEKDWVAEVTLRTTAFTEEQARKIFEDAIDNLCDINEASVDEVRED